MNKINQVFANRGDRKLLSLYFCAGCPTLDGLGTTGGHVHQLGEYINISHLPFRLAFTAEMTLRVLERSGD